MFSFSGRSHEDIEEDLVYHFQHLKTGERAICVPNYQQRVGNSIFRLTVHCNAIARPGDRTWNNDNVGKGEIGGHNEINTQACIDRHYVLPERTECIYCYIHKNSLKFCPFCHWKTLSFFYSFPPFLCYRFVHNNDAVSWRYIYIISRHNRIKYL